MSELKTLKDINFQWHPDIHSQETGKKTDNIIQSRPDKSKFKDMIYSQYIEEPE